LCHAILRAVIRDDLKVKKVCPLSVRVLFTNSCILAHNTCMLQTSQSDQQDGNGVLILGGKYVKCPMV